MKNSFASTFILCFLLFLSFSSTSFAQNPKCFPQDQKAIDQIQAAFSINPTGDCCDWDPVVCDNAPPYRVTDLLIINSNISGQIPDAIGDLSSLLFLELVYAPNLTGKIPPAISKLSNLVTLAISHSRLSGPVPNFLVNLKNLNSIDLSFNDLTGTIPPELSLFQNLQVLRLNRNKLTGTIPESFGHFSKSFQFFSLSRNFLNGTIPKSLGNLNLYEIDLSQNNFTGDASFLFGKNKITESLMLQRNNFTFDLTKVEFSANLSKVDLSHKKHFRESPAGVDAV